MGQLIGTHNVALGKRVSEILETNVLAPLNIELNRTLQPIISIEPYIDIFKSTSGTGAVYTTPTDKDFYLVGIYFSMESILAAPGFNNLAVIGKDGLTVNIRQYYGHALDETSIRLQPCQDSIFISFPKRGFLCAKGSALTFTLTSSAGMCSIIGYTDSDRSQN